jgi:anti-sigma B factor antagonist
MGGGGEGTEGTGFLLFALGLTNLSAPDHKRLGRFKERTSGLPGRHEGVATLDIETKTQDGVKVVKMKGRLRMGPALDRFNGTLDELLSQGQYKVVLDVEDVPTIDSSGIGMLVRHLTTAKQGGGAIRLLKPSKFTVQTLKMVGVLNLFMTFEDLPQAVASFR